MPASATVRVNMAKGQLMTNEVLDQALLDAITSVPREKCVPLALSGSAYVDDNLEVAAGRFLPSPLTFARLLQLANIQPGERVLDVGALQGYSTAVIARLAANVIGLETDPALVAAAQKNLLLLGIANASVVQTPRFDGGHIAGGPYDVIVIEGAVAARPSELLRQLAPGGRLVAVELPEHHPGATDRLGRLVEFVNRDGVVLRKETLEVPLPILPGFEAKTSFTFE